MQSLLGYVIKTIASKLCNYFCRINQGTIKLANT